MSLSSSGLLEFNLARWHVADSDVPILANLNDMVLCVCRDAPSRVASDVVLLRRIHPAIGAFSAAAEGRSSKRR